jgi:hypothetical protein
LLIVGEIRTCVLQNSGALPSSVLKDVLGLLPGERVRVSERPMAQALSPERITGVDCPLPTLSGSRCRGVGTVAARAVVTGGRLLQASVYARVERGVADHRLPWSHYLALPGVVRTTGRFDGDDIAAGYLADPAPARTLDLGAVGERLISSVQLHGRLDHLVSLRTRRTRVRWVARIGDIQGGGTRAEFTLVDDVVRTLSIVSPDDDVADMVGFCEDLALHDWILSTVLRMVERSGLGSASGAAAVDRLRPAIDQLLHLWMPGAHVSWSLLSLWKGIESCTGLDRQWSATVTRIRDQIMMNMMNSSGAYFLREFSVGNGR